MNPGRSLEAEEASVGEEVGLNSEMLGSIFTPASQVSVWIVMTPFTVVMDGRSLAPMIFR